MDFSRTVEIAAPIGEVWALAGEIPAVAGCIPGVRDIEMVDDDSLSCVLAQQVGSVKAKFSLRSRLVVDADNHVVDVTSEGQDRNLGSTVKATQRFTLTPDGDGTKVDIAADVQISGRIATFGHRIIAAKAEQVTVDAVRNVDRLLESRRAG